MPGYTENRVLIYRDYDHVFDLTNNISLWPQLFTEYKTARVLEEKGNYIKFELTTFATENKPSKTWVSERFLDKINHSATAERLTPKFPFSYMKIRWEYEVIEKTPAVLMTWIQEFDIDPACPFSVEQMESYLNKNTYQQIKSVKNKVEQWHEELSTVTV